MFGFGETFKMLGSSWQVLKKDLELLLFFFLSMACKLALVYFAYKNWMRLYPDGIESLRQDLQGQRHDFYIAAAAFVFAYHLIGQFFNAAIIGSAARRLSGRNPNVLTGLWDALKRLPSLILWAVLYACLMTITGLFRRKGKIQKLLGGAVQAAFHIITFFVLPLIMIENAFPLSAMGRSAQLLGKTWGNQVVANISLFVFRFLMAAPGAALIAYSSKLPENPGDMTKTVCFGAGVFLVVLSTAIVQTLTEIYRTALYLFVRDQKAPDGFSEHQLQGAFRQA